MPNATTPKSGPTPGGPAKAVGRPIDPPAPPYRSAGAGLASLPLANQPVKPANLRKFASTDPVPTRPAPKLAPPLVRQLHKLVSPPPPQVNVAGPLSQVPGVSVPPPTTRAPPIPPLP